jgi:hypothetical protein
MKKYPRIRETHFGEITLGSKPYACDVVIFASSKIKKRDKSIAKERYGTSHKIGPRELKRVCRKEPEILFIGTGQDDQARLTGKGRRYLEKNAIAVEALPTPELIDAWNRSKKRKAALIHVTC